MVTETSEGGERGPLLLRPKVSPLLHRFLRERELLSQLLNGMGSPLNLLFPQAVIPNLIPFENVLSKYKVPGRIFFAHKANQSHSVLSELALTGAGVDVASVQELRHALGCGFTGARIEATGPKNEEFLYLCLMHGVVVNVDSAQELEQVAALKALLGKSEKVQILLRLNDFKGSQNNVIAKQSRFGTRFGEVPELLTRVAELGDDMELLGFSFHLDSVSLDERVVAIENCFRAIELAIDLGMEPRVINAGGHFRVNYLEYEEDWIGYESAVKRAVLGIGPEVTWQNKHFGLTLVANRIRGIFTSYGFFEGTTGAAFLQKILESELPSYAYKKIGALLRENEIALWLEPGRALLDQAGITLAVVNTVKTSSSGDTLVVLNMKRSDIGYLDQEIFVDPILIGADASKDNSYVPVYLAGSLCLESDLIYRHLTYLPALPKPGDILAFVNTAAYSMDFSASNTAMQPPATRLAVSERGTAFNWISDERYTPVPNLNRKE